MALLDWLFAAWATSKICEKKAEREVAEAMTEYLDDEDDEIDEELWDDEEYDTDDEYDAEEELWDDDEA